MRPKPNQPPPDALAGEVIASFGDAQLIKKPDRRYELVGGTEADRAEAEKWISMFMKYDAVQGSAHRPEPRP